MGLLSDMAEMLFNPYIFQLVLAGLLIENETPRFTGRSAQARETI